MMSQFETILVVAALDRRDATSLIHAARLAQIVPAKRVHVVHVEPIGDDFETLSTPEYELDDRLRALLDGHRGQFPAATELRTAVRHGSRVTALVKLSAECSADVVVACRRPYDEHDALSDAIVQLGWKLPCSLLVVPEGMEQANERILVPFDFSNHSLAALAAAVAIARATPQASLTIQHVVSVPIGYYRAGHSYEEFAASMKARAEESWEKLRPTLPLDGVPLTVRFDDGDSIPRTICDAAGELDASLIVAGSHGRTRPAGAVLGHVADGIGARTTRPFLCVKKKGEVVTLLHALLQLYEFE